MSILNIISLMGGLAFFLYGMTVMANGLERASGGRLERTLEYMTDNIFKAIFLGMIVTAAIQSSSATTVIIVGLVNARILKLRQAIGIIMGANIGTTVTAHIIRMTDIDASANFAFAFLKPTTLAPIAAVIGIFLQLASKSKSKRDIGLIFLGFGILFSGMFAMEEALYPLRTMPQFAEWFASFSNPILGVLAGTVVTAIIQSSSASVGILQALTSTGVITFSAAFPIIMGQNIGTCITPVLASIGASKNAKRAAFIHVTFNTLGTMFFLIVIYTIQYTIGFDFWNDPITKGGIANFHTIFNVTVTILFIPFTSFLEILAKIFIKSDGDDAFSDDEVDSLDDRFLTSPSFAIDHARDAVEKMAKLSMDNYVRSIKLLSKFDAKRIDRAKEVENVIDRLQSRIDNYLLKLAKEDLTESENIALSEVLQVVNEFERIGDHADNICKCAQSMSEIQAVFSPKAAAELAVLNEAIEEILSFAVDGYIARDTNLVMDVEPLEEVINILVESLKVSHSERLRDGTCTIDSAFPYIEVLYNLERIADHCSNIGVHVISYSGHGVLDRHEYLREMHSSQSSEYKSKFDMYDKKYFERIKSIEIS